jgi:protocatechuate 3,4-dioxygenase beta subunit
VEANEHKHPAVYATTTDNDGRFEIKQVAAGRYEFLASKIGYIEQHYRSKDGEDQGAILSLTSGQTVDDAIFRMVRAGVITGRVVDDTGEPMMGVTVSVLHKPGEEEREVEGPRRKKLEMIMVSGGSTDDRGEYRIYSLKPGEYYLKAAATGGHWISGGTMMMSGTDWALMQELGSPYSPLFYSGVLQLEQAQAITLGPGEETQADFAMRKVKMVEVAGRVLGPDGGPAIRTYVQLSQAGVSDWGVGMGASTDSGGRFSIKGISPGSYVVSAGTQEQGKYYNTRQKIEVGETNLDSLILAVGRGATIRGRMRTATGAPLPTSRIMVHLESMEEEGPTGGFTEVNKDGSFELSGVADGSYSVMSGNLAEGWFLESAHMGNEDVLENGVQVENGAAKGALDLVVSNDGAQIEGMVTDSEKDQPIAGAVVRAQFDPATDYAWMSERTATTDQNGHYLLKDVPPHKYNVTAKMPKTSAGAAMVKSAAVPVTLKERDHRELDFKLELPKSE